MKISFLISPPLMGGEFKGEGDAVFISIYEPKTRESFVKIILIYELVCQIFFPLFFHLTAIVQVVTI
jgi:hypothetical protein